MFLHTSRRSVWFHASSSHAFLETVLLQIFRCNVYKQKHFHHCVWPFGVSSETFFLQTQNHTNTSMVFSLNALACELSMSKPVCSFWDRCHTGNSSRLRAQFSCASSYSGWLQRLPGTQGILHQHPPWWSPSSNLSHNNQRLRSQNLATPETLNVSTPSYNYLG